jgi:hypothetical protein
MLCFSIFGYVGGSPTELTCLRFFPFPINELLRVPFLVSYVHYRETISICGRSTVLMSCILLGSLPYELYVAVRIVPYSAWLKEHVTRQEFNESYLLVGYYIGGFLVPMLRWQDKTRSGLTNMI